MLTYWIFDWLLVERIELPLLRAITQWCDPGFITSFTPHFDSQAHFSDEKTEAPKDYVPTGPSHRPALSHLCLSGKLPPTDPEGSPPHPPPQTPLEAPPGGSCKDLSGLPGLLLTSATLWSSCFFEKHLWWGGGGLSRACTHLSSRRVFGAGGGLSESLRRRRTAHASPCAEVRRALAASICVIRSVD